MARDSVATIIAVGAAGVAGWALLTRTATPEGQASSTAAGSAGQGSRLPQESATAPAHSASSVPAREAGRSAFSDLWGRVVGPPRPYSTGARETGGDSMGRAVPLTFAGYDQGTRSARWTSRSGTFRIPWDTSPLSYYWDNGRPHGGDAGATAKADAREVALAVQDAATLGFTNVTDALLPPDKAAKVRNPGIISAGFNAIANLGRFLR